MEILIYGGVMVATAVLIVIALSKRLIVRNYEIFSEKIKGEVKAVHISDLHECRFGEAQIGIVDIVRSSSPDVIVITGDMVEDDESDPAEGQVMTVDNAARQLFCELVGIAPVFMVLGNHESNIPNTDLLSKEIEDLGVRLLHRRNPDDPDMLEEIEVRGEKILICGADDPYFDRREQKTKRRGLGDRLREDRDVHGCGKDIWRGRLRREYGFVKSEKRLTLLLSHRPEEYVLYRELGFDAAFSGHAHGGQWRLPPFINGVYAPNQGIFPSHAGGCYRYDGFTHVVSRGLSTKRMVRIFNRPEICVVTFKGR